MIDPRAIGNVLTSARAYVDETRVLDVFRELRAAGTPQRLTPDNVRPFWAVTRHAQIMEASMHNEVFVSSKRLTLINLEQEAAAMRAGARYGRVLRTLVHMDEPDHTAYRQVAQQWFTGKSLEAMQARLDALSDEYVDTLVAAGDGAVVDFAQLVSIWYPLRVIQQMLGLPIEDIPMLHQLTKTLAAPEDPELGDAARPADVMFESIPVFTEYFLKVIEDRRRHPKDDISTILANGKVNDGPMGELETVSYFITLAVAGHDTTSAAMGGGLWAFAHHPDQWALLRARPDLARGAANEMIRWITPIKNFMRTAVADYDLGGQRIAKGESIAMFYLAANRDEEVFAEPDAFRIERNPNRQIAFGYGPHMCLGMVLARMEIASLFTALTRRFARVEPVGPLRHVEANFLSGFKSVPVRLWSS